MENFLNIYLRAHKSHREVYVNIDVTMATEY